MKFRPVTGLMVGFVKLWRRLISPLYGDVCKFHPTCSAYGLEALQAHGAVKGGWLTVTRILRCHPWSMGGWDPVPGTPGHARKLAEEAGQGAEEPAGPAGPAPHSTTPLGVSTATSRGVS